MPLVGDGCISADAARLLPGRRGPAAAAVVVVGWGRYPGSCAGRTGVPTEPASAATPTCRTRSDPGPCAEGQPDGADSFLLLRACALPGVHGVSVSRTAGRQAPRNAGNARIVPVHPPAAPAAAPAPALRGAHGAGGGGLFAGAEDDSGAGGAEDAYGGGDDGEEEEEMARSQEQLRWVVGGPVGVGVGGSGRGAVTAGPSVGLRPVLAGP